MPKAEIQKIDYDVNVRVTLVCDQEEDKADLQSIRDELELSDVKNYFVLNEALTELVVEFNELMNSIDLAEDRLGKSVSKTVAERRNADLKVNIAEDKMSADARIVSAWGGAQVTANQIVKYAQEQGVSYGFDKKAIVSLAKKAGSAKPGLEFSETIAKGSNAVNGANARLEQLVLTAKDRILKPQENEDGTVDMRDLGKIISVKPGTPMMRRHPPTEGKAGTNVMGEFIETHDGDDLDMIAGDGTYIDANDSNLLIAERIGLPKLIENGMVVNDVFEVAKVDVSTGHVEYSGSVIVNGDVGEGMRVISKGDVNISGFVDSAYIEAKGDVVIGKAAIGKQLDDDVNHETECSTIIRAEGNVYIKHAQYIEVFSGKRLHIEKQLLHSRVNAHTVVVGKEDNPDGKIIGGYFKLQHSLTTGTLGAPAGSRSVIELNQRFEKLVEKKEQLKDEIERQKKILAEIKTAVEHIKFLPHNEERKKLLNECIGNFESHKKLLQQFTWQLKMLEEKQKQIFSVVSVEVKDKLYHGVEFTISNDTVRCRRDYGPSVVKSREGRVTVQPLT